MTAATLYDVVGIGNAIVDVIARADDDFLIGHGLHKGGMTLIDEAASARLYAAMGSATIMSGGSAANTMAGVASLGGKAGFIGFCDAVSNRFSDVKRWGGKHFKLWGK